MGPLPPSCEESWLERPYGEEKRRYTAGSMVAAASCCIAFSTLICTYF